MAKRKRKSFNARAKALIRPRHVSVAFPLVGKATLKTKVGFHDVETLVNGFVNVAILTPANIDDPFGDMPVVGLDGAQDPNSLYEAHGKDLLAIPYKTYRCYQSEIIIRWRQHQEIQSSVIQAHDITGHLTDTATVAAQTISPTIPTHAVTIVAVPSDELSIPCQSWAEAMNHPLAIRSYQKMSSTVSSKWQTMRIPIHHKSFMDLYHNYGETKFGEGMHRHPFGTIPLPEGEQPVVHLFFCDEAGSADSAVDIIGTIQVIQKVLLYKATGDANGVMAILGNEYVPTVTG